MKKTERIIVRLYLKEYNQIINLLETGNIEEIPLWRLFHQHYPFLGISYAQKKDFQKAQEQIENILRMDNPSKNVHQFYFTSKYYIKARIEAAMGEKEKATQSLKKAIEEKNSLRQNTFKEDVFLKPLFGYPPFEELVKPKG